jgi:hypothetical protein
MNVMGPFEGVQGPPSLRVLDPLAPRRAGHSELRTHRRGRMASPRLRRLRLAPRLTVVGGGRNERYWPVIAGRIGAAVTDRGPGPDAPLVA